MVWIPPRKRSSKSHSTMMSKYKDLEQSDYFRLQQRKSAPKKNKPGAWFRIATLGQYPFYEVAYGETEDAIRNNEWNYIKTKVEGEKRAELLKMNAQQRMDWIVKHFSALGGTPVKTDGHETDSDTDGTENSVKRGGSYSSPPPAAAPTTKPASRSVGEAGGHQRAGSYGGEKALAASSAASSAAVSTGNNGNGGNNNSSSGNGGISNSVHNSGGSNSVNSSHSHSSHTSHTSSSHSSSSSSSSSSSHSSSSLSARESSSHISKKAPKIEGSSRGTSKQGKKDPNTMVPVVLGVAGVVLNMVLVDFWFLRLLLSLFTLLFVLSSYFTWAAHALFKINLNCYGLCSMVASQDKKFKRTKVLIPDMRDEQAKVVMEKRLIFIRHGESEWNSVFNKGLKVLLPRLFDALVKEAFLMTTLDSVFFDSPLNKEGLQQASQMSNWLVKDKKPSKPAVIEAVNFLNGTSQDDSVIVSSPLRRAVSTTVIGLRRRLKEKGEKVKILSSLAEISSNVDTISLADEPGSLPDLNSLAAYCSTLQPKYTVTNDCFDASENKGRKPILGSGQDRLSEFCGWVFKRKEAAIIVGGHSLYFRYFFRSFLPTQAAHPLKENKVPNNGIVMFTLQKLRGRDNQNIFRIDPATIVEVYGFGHD